VRCHQKHDGDEGEERNGGGDQLNDGLAAIGVPVKIAMGGKSFRLQAQLRRKLRLVLNIQVVPQYELMIPESPCTWFAGLRL
jgi:hypothetical protein